jgi:hypothetical protein
MHAEIQEVYFILRQTRSHLAPDACIPKKKQQQKRQKTKQSKAKLHKNKHTNKKRSQI